MFKKNEGAADRGLRTAFGILMVGSLGLYPILQSTPLAIVGLVGLVPLITGITGFCPLYRIVNFDSGVEPEPSHS